MSEADLAKVLMQFQHLCCEDCGDSKVDCTCEEGAIKARQQELIELASDDSRKLMQQQKQGAD